VVGAGAVGLTAAIQAGAAGLNVVVLARTVPGGFVGRLARVETIAGHAIGLTGGEFVARATARAERFGARIVNGAEAIGLIAEVQCAGQPRLTHARSGPVAYRHLVRLASGTLVSARAVLLAMGVDRPLPPVPGVGRLLGSGVHVALPAVLPASFCCRNVLIVGDDDAAARAARRLAAGCRTVRVATSQARDRFPLASITGESPASPATRLDPRTAAPDAPVGAVGRIALLYETELLCADGVDHLEVVLLRHARTGRVTAANVDALFCLGTPTPRTAWLPPTVLCDPAGFVVTGAGPQLSGTDASEEGPAARRLETSVAGVFAVGEVRQGGAGSAAALDDAIHAVRQIQDYLHTMERPKADSFDSTRKTQP
jgi:thioredoxin reductase (NADPH)